MNISSNCNRLPSESEVMAELENFLTKKDRPVSPSEAYRYLADTFKLSRDDRTRLMPNGKDVHWENRVRFARRKLKDMGKLDNSQPRGKWAIKCNTYQG